MRSQPASSRHGSRGFTLLELLVAMAIFAIISVLALGGLNAVATQQSLTRSNLDDLARLQRAFDSLERDLGQLYPRPVRDELGQDREAALLADGRDDYLLRLTRGGWRNPAQLPRGSLQRVQYRLAERQLIREYWPVLDHPLGMEPISQVLLDGVDAVQVEFLDADGQWREQWPPLSALNDPAIPRPRAARLTLELDGWGEIQRLVEMLP
ncbi:MAG: type II secretion system protein GspJ [Gammaproteobacteria bacterium]|nr:MAG: type II secretion system protein GspJ [Gammaproteobacteria bacterium]